jgi:hypothetical protein
VSAPIVAPALGLDDRAAVVTGASDGLGARFAEDRTTF